MRAAPTSLLRALRVLLALTCALLGVAVASSAAAAEGWQVPRSARIVIRGHGYGHGHGLSQYGAEGAARQGLGYRQIADFYYPGTDWGRTRRTIDVLITADTTDDLVVRATDGLRLRDRGTGELLTLPDKPTSRWRTTVARNGATRVTWRDGARWRGWRRLEGLGSFSVAGGPVTLVTPAGETSYRGELTAVPPSPGSRDRATVNRVGLEAYLRGVVPLEIPALWSPAAVRAQAVAARSYAAYERAHPRAGWYDICDTWSCQVYGGASAEHPASDAAVRGTRRRILTYDGAPAFTQFGSSSGGWTAAGSVPYLTAHEDPYDGWSGNPNHDWRERVDDRTFERAWPSLGELRRIVVVSRDGNGQWGGRIGTLRLVGSRGRVTVSGDTARSALGLKSTWLTFRVR